MVNSRMDRTQSDVREMEEIDLLELFRAILKHIKLIIVLCILFGVGGFFGTKLLIAPTYTASTSIYLTPQISESGSLDYNSQMANSKLVTNVVNLLTQNNIMSEVAKDVGLDSASSVKKLVSVSNESNTEIITISATTTDPKLSKDIANDTVSTFIRTMQKNLNVRNIEVTVCHPKARSFLRLGAATARISYHSAHTGCAGANPSAHPMFCRLSWPWLFGQFFGPIFPDLNESVPD